MLFLSLKSFTQFYMHNCNILVDGRFLFSPKILVFYKDSNEAYFIQKWFVQSRGGWLFVLTCLPQLCKVQSWPGCCLECPWTRPGETARNALSHLWKVWLLSIWIQLQIWERFITISSVRFYCPLIFGIIMREFYGMDQSFQADWRSCTNRYVHYFNSE